MQIVSALNYSTLPLIFPIWILTWGIGNFLICVIFSGGKKLLEKQTTRERVYTAFRIYDPITGSHIDFPFTPAGKIA